MDIFDEGEGYRGIRERMAEEKDTVEEYCSNLRKQIKKLKEDKSLILDALEATKLFLEHGPEFPLHLLADTEELQEIVKEALALVKDGKSAEKQG